MLFLAGVTHGCMAATTEPLMTLTKPEDSDHKGVVYEYRDAEQNGGEEAVKSGVLYPTEALLELLDKTGDGARYWVKDAKQDFVKLLAQQGINVAADDLCLYQKVNHPEHAPRRYKSSLSCL